MRIYFSLASGVVCLAFLLSACGSGQSKTPQEELENWTKGTFRNSKDYLNLCQKPRSGQNPITNKAFPDRQGSTALENHYLRSWSHEDYFWYDELPDLDPRETETTDAYFKKLVTPEKTANGTPKDRFHFTEDEVQGDQVTFSGERGGYGINWVAKESQRFVLYVDNNSPASNAGVTRGMELISAEGIALDSERTQLQTDRLNEAAFNPELDNEYSFVFKDTNGELVDITMTAQNVPISAVNTLQIIETSTGSVGYIAFTTFNTFTAENQLKDAFERFEAENINDLVLDIRYNGGGFLYISSQLSYLIAGQSSTDNEEYATLLYNDKRIADNVPLPFVDETVSGEGAPQPLTSVDLNRVYILTTASTCSASEAVMNGLRGIGVEVIQIGGTTCGKAHGFNGVTNCGTRYFSIDFEVVNGQGFGEYTDGFEPVASGDAMTNKVTGCKVKDDLSYALGDISEPMLNTALFYRDNGMCPPVATARSKAGQSKTSNAIISSGEMIRSETESNMRLAP